MVTVKLSTLCLTACSALACAPPATVHDSAPLKAPELASSAAVPQQSVPEIDPYADLLVNADALHAKSRHAAESGRFLSIDVESFALGDSLAALEAWQLEPLRGLGETLRNNAQDLMRADFVASTEGVQTLHIRPTILLATERYVTIAQQIDILERSQRTLGSVRSARCATVRRSDGGLLVKSDMLLPGAPLHLDEPGGEANGPVCLVKRGIWLVDEVLNSPVMGEDDPSRVTPGIVVPYEALGDSIRSGLLPLSDRPQKL